MESEKRNVPLTDITLDERLQPRAALDRETVEDYAARYAEGADLPAVTLFRDGGAYLLADGFHRVAGAKRAGLAAIPAEVRGGSFRDALLFAAGANAAHGLRRTNADKRRAVEMLLADPECVAWSDNQIAKHCQVNHHLVAEMRSRHLGELQDDPATPTVDPSHSGPCKTVTRNGITYTMRVGNIGRRSSPSPEPPATALPAPAAGGGRGVAADRVEEAMRSLIRDATPERAGEACAEERLLRPFQTGIPAVAGVTANRPGEARGIQSTENRFFSRYVRALRKRAAEVLASFGFVPRDEDRLVLPVLDREGRPDRMGVAYCPFCGGFAEATGTDDGLIQVFCRVCGAMGAPDPEGADARERWNTRY